MSIASPDVSCRNSAECRAESPNIPIRTVNRIAEIKLRWSYCIREHAANPKNRGARDAETQGKPAIPKSMGSGPLRHPDTNTWPFIEQFLLVSNNLSAI
jgi:hypothetical protein